MLKVWFGILGVILIGIIFGFLPMLLIVCVIVTSVLIAFSVGEALDKRSEGESILKGIRDLKDSKRSS